MSSTENSIRESGIELVFLPGLDGTGLTYGPLGNAMYSGIPITVVQYPVDRELSFQQLAENAFEQIPHDRPVVLIAESFSGPIAIHVVTTMQHSVKGIVFCATFMKFEHHFLTGISRLVPLTLLLRPPVPDFVLAVLCGDKSIVKELSSLFREIEKRTSPEILSHRIRMLNDVDVSEESSMITVPCCYIQATQDRLVSRSSIRPFQENLRDITIRKIKGPHAILQSRPRECAVVIMEFVTIVSELLASS